LHSGAVTDEGKVFMWGENPDTRIFKKVENYKSGNPKKYYWP
jgi:hypothetical protein